VFLLVACGIIKLLEYPIYGASFTTYNINVYTGGVITGSFVILRVLILIISSAVLTLTTKPTDLNNGLEALLKPFGKKMMNAKDYVNGIGKETLIGKVFK
jgi:energy-coupling factor transport system permease protein